MPSKTIHRALLAWFDAHGRNDLPWQIDRTPYRVWVSEIMLQQTQVSTVIPYFQRFMQAFPTVQSLAAASKDEVMHHWTGLGYYARARNLQRSAHIITHDLHGRFPEDLDGWQQLPGVGRSTAGAILAIALNKKTAILDGNVKRVLTRLHAITEWPGEKNTTAILWKIAEELTPGPRVADYTQAIMDLGATLCMRRNPLCPSCPLKKTCAARQQGIADTLPRAKPRRVLPVKTATLLLIHHRHHILLQKRPDQGIWSSLWSLPEIKGHPSSKPALTKYCKDHLHIKTRKPTPTVPPFRHTFSHFHLDIHPISLHCETPRALDSQKEIWYNLQQPQAIGLPAPIKKLLDNETCHESFTAPT